MNQTRLRVRTFVKSGLVFRAAGLAGSASLSAGRQASGWSIRAIRRTHRR
jgi:hypothetical protein